MSSTATILIKWIQDALEANPALSQSGLARHLERDRSVVSNMLAGKRNIKATEVEEIAAYLGVPPPVLGHAAASSSKPREVRVMGRVSKDWHEVNGFEPQGRATISGTSDERFPLEHQMAFELAPGMRDAVGNATHLIVVPTKAYRPAPMVGDLFLTKQKQGTLVNHQLVRATRGKNNAVTLTRIDGTVETGHPDYFVIMAITLLV